MLFVSSDLAKKYISHHIHILERFSCGFLPLQGKNNSWHYLRFQQKIKNERAGFVFFRSVNWAAFVLKSPPHVTLCDRCDEAMKNTPRFAWSSLSNKCINFGCKNVEVSHSLSRTDLMTFCLIQQEVCG